MQIVKMFAFPSAPSGIVLAIVRYAMRTLLTCAMLALFSLGCDAPVTNVILDNEYSPTQSRLQVIYQAFWQAVSFTTPVPPGAASDAQLTVAASANSAYALIAPGWDPMSGAPASLLVLQSRDGFAVSTNTTLRIPVDDNTFAGNCNVGSFLDQVSADFITQRVFPSVFAGHSYDAATCTTSP
jgi:hypothetical protein